jgi:hypothetical protein
MNALRQWDGGSPHSLRGELLQAEDASWAEFRAITRWEQDVDEFNWECYEACRDLNLDTVWAQLHTHHEEHLPRLREWVDLLEIPE